MNEVILSSPEPGPLQFFTPTPKAARRVMEFFTTQINNDHTRKAYLNATRRFSAWCEGKEIDQLVDESVRNRSASRSRGSHPK